MFTVLTSSASVILPKSVRSERANRATGMEVVLHGFEPERDDVDISLETIDPNEKTANIERGDDD